MFCLTRLLAAILVIFCLSVPAPGFSYGEGGGGEGGGGEGEGEGEGRADGGGGAGLTGATTKTVVHTLTNGLARCQRVRRVYRFDCYRQTYHLAASLLNGRPAYRDARKALDLVEAALDKIMKHYVDPSVPRKRQGFRTYRAIKPAAIPRATNELDRALDKAETVLLRAPERTGMHYARIAEAVHSNKVLLRSRLYPDADDLFRTAIA